MKQLKNPNIKPFLFIIICHLVQPLAVRGENRIPIYNDNIVTCCDERITREEIFVHTDREEYIAGENIWFRIYLFDPQSGRLTSASNLAYVEILNSENRPVLQKRIRLEEGCGSGEAILPDTLSSGSYLLRAYTGAMKNFMPNGCFMKRINIYNALGTDTYLNAAEEEKSMANDPGIAADKVTRQKISTPPTSKAHIEMTSPDSCGIRDRIILQFEIRDNSSESARPAHLSISVAPFTGIHGPDITAPVKNASGDTTLQEGTHKYDFENEYHFIYGHLFNRNTHMPDSGKYIFLSIPGEKAVFYYSRTDSDGMFRLSVPIDEVARELIIQPEVVTGDNAISIESSFSDEFQAYHANENTARKPSLSYISDMKVNYQVSRIYETQNSLLPPAPQLAGRPEKSFYGIPDISLDLDDFIRLPVMEEVFYELVPGVTLREKKSGYEMNVADPYYDVVYDQPPITFIDGVVVSDPAIIAGIDPDLVERIDVIRDRYLVGDYLFFGLVNVITYDGDYSRVSLPDHAVRLPYRVFDPVRKFYSPDYSTEEKRRDRTPDFRNTLFWEPSVTPSGDGKYRVEFWSSDVAGDYEINLQGVTEDGDPVSFRKVIKIK